MLEQTQTLSSMAVSLTAAAFVDVPYSPAFLLESRFDASITDDPEFPFTCGCGFDAYFAEMFEWNEEHTDLVFVEKCYTWAEVVELVTETMLHGDKPERVESRSARAGFALGWLSALALVNREWALMGLTLLTVLVTPSWSSQRRHLAT